MVKTNYPTIRLINQRRKKNFLVAKMIWMMIEMHNLLIKLI